MGTQTMGSQSDQQQQQEQQFLPLSRQTSLYSLTLDEVQTQLGGLGKPLGSMNLDELLKNVCTDENDNAIAATSALQRQPSLRDKTVDEVWREIQQGQGKGGNHDKKVQERQPTFGEMTLEDFLFKAGVVSQSSSEDKAMGADLNISTPQAQWLQFQLPSLQQQQPQPSIISGFVPMHSQPLPVVPNTILDSNFSENQMAISSPLMGTLSDTQTPGRKRGHPGDMIEKTVERRQKRMIKNRESAARSRARKQAYTHELENKVSRLEEENARLKKEKCLFIRSFHQNQIFPSKQPIAGPWVGLLARRRSRSCHICHLRRSQNFNFEEQARLVSDWHGHGKFCRVAWIVVLFEYGLEEKVRGSYYINSLSSCLLLHPSAVVLESFWKFG